MPNEKLAVRNQHRPTKSFGLIGLDGIFKEFEILNRFGVILLSGEHGRAFP
jgi:hypothetical protein